MSVRYYITHFFSLFCWFFFIMLYLNGRAHTYRVSSKYRCPCLSLARTCGLLLFFFFSSYEPLRLLFSLSVANERARSSARARKERRHFSCCRCCCRCCVPNTHSTQWKVMRSVVLFSFRFDRHDILNIPKNKKNYQEKDVCGGRKLYSCMVHVHINDIKHASSSSILFCLYQQPQQPKSKMNKFSSKTNECVSIFFSRFFLQTAWHTVLQQAI